MSARANRIPRAIPTRPGLRERLRRLLAWLLRRRAAAIRAERRQYEAAGAIGPIFQFNSIRQELELLIRARRLEENT